MTTPAEPNLPELLATLEKMLAQLHAAKEKLPRGPDRTEVEQILRSLEEPVRGFGPAALQAQGEIAALQARSDEMAKAFVLPPEASAPATEAPADLHQRWRREILERYAPSSPKPTPKEPAKEVMFDSVRSGWEDSVSSESSTPPPPPAARPAVPVPPKSKADDLGSVASDWQSESEGQAANSGGKKGQGTDQPSKKPAPKPRAPRQTKGKDGWDEFSVEEG